MYMTFFEYVTKMQELGSPVAIVGLVILALFLLIIVLKMLGGLRRGVWRQLVRTGMTLLAAVVSYIAAIWLSNHIIGSLNAENFESLIALVESYVPELGNTLREAISSFDGELVEYILLLPSAILLIPILTTLLFFVVNFVLKIVRAIIIKILGFKKARNSTQRLGGAILAAIEGLIWITMVMLPICGALSLVDQAYDKAISSAEGESKTELIETYDAYLAPLTNNPAITFINSFGADAMANGIATVKIDDEQTNIREEILSFAHIIIVDGSSLKGADLTAPTQEQKEAIGSIVDALGESPIMSRVLVHTLHSVPSIYNSGLIPLDLGEEYGVIVDNLLTFLATTERETIGADLDTIQDFYFGFCDSGLISAIQNGEDIMQFISDDYNSDRHVLGMINTLSGNQRTQGIVDGMYNLVLNAAFSGSSGSTEGENGGDSAALPEINIQDVKEGINNIVSVNKSDYETEEEYREELSNTIGTTINDTIGVELEEEVVDEIADYVDENYSEQLEDLTDEEFNELIFEVIDIYQGYLNGEEINPDDLEGLLPDGDSQ